MIRVFLGLVHFFARRLGFEFCSVPNIGINQNGLNIISPAGWSPFYPTSTVDDRWMESNVIGGICALTLTFVVINTEVCAPVCGSGAHLFACVFDGFVLR